MEIQLRKFDMNKIKDDKVVVLIGKRETGKSFLCRDLLYHHRDIPCGQVISGTEAANQFYSSMVPKLFIHEEYQGSVIQNVLKRQKLMIEKQEKVKKEKFNKTLINLSSNLKSDLFNEDEIENNLHTIYDASLHKFTIPIKKINT